MQMFSGRALQMDGITHQKALVWSTYGMLRTVRSPCGSRGCKGKGIGEEVRKVVDVVRRNPRKTSTVLLQRVWRP